MTEDPPADAEEWTRSVHRAIEIRGKRRRVLSTLRARLTAIPARARNACKQLGGSGAAWLAGDLSRDVIAGRRVLRGAGRSA